MEHIPVRYALEEKVHFNSRICGLYFSVKSLLLSNQTTPSIWMCSFDKIRKPLHTRNTLELPCQENPRCNFLVQLSYALIRKITACGHIRIRAQNG